MTQGLSILTGCSAGATEAVVVVPFEYDRPFLNFCYASDTSPFSGLLRFVCRTRAALIPVL